MMDSLDSKQYKKRRYAYELDVIIRLRRWLVVNDALCEGFGGRPSGAFDDIGELGPIT